MLVPFPTEQFHAYLKEFDVASVDVLTKTQKMQIFLKAIADFYNGLLSVDALSGLATRLWSTMGSDRSGEPLADAMLAASELAYYSRAIATTNPKALERFGDFLVKVRAYYDANK